MSYKDHRLEVQLNGLSNCPHCGVSAPLLFSVWQSTGHVQRTDGGKSRSWAAYACTSCGSVVAAEGISAETVANPMVEAIFPDIWEPDTAIPQTARKYLRQARNTLASPDASVVMSASGVDAMLKHFDLVDGTLYARIDQAVKIGILTSVMATWAHQIRVDANNPRHADKMVPHLTTDDAKRALDFARAIAEVLFVLPSRMPKTPN